MATGARGSKMVRQPRPYQPSASGAGVAACQKPAAERATAASQRRSRGLRNQPHAASTKRGRGNVDGDVVDGVARLGKPIGRRRIGD